MTAPSPPDDRDAWLDGVRRWYSEARRRPAIARSTRTRSKARARKGRPPSRPAVIGRRSPVRGAERAGASTS